MFYKFDDCIILETFNEEYNCVQYRVIQVKNVNNKKSGEIIKDEYVTIFNETESDITDKQIKDKNPRLTDKSIKHILDLFHVNITDKLKLAIENENE